jgi:hypothetical protein
MGHAYVAAEGCDEATVLGVCSSDDEEGLLESLMEMHDDQVRLESAVADATRAPVAKPKARPKKTAKPTTIQGTGVMV